MENPFLTILNNIDVIVYVADMKTYEILYLNDYTKKLFGNIEGKICWQTLQVDQRGPCSFCTNDKIVDAAGNPTGTYHWEFQNTVTGQWFDIRDTAIKWEDGRIVRLEFATDITERKKMEDELRAATLTDYLTGLLNRRGFFTIADQQCKLALRSKRAMGLLFIDLDGFKNINDELGHEIGDQALMETANILRNTFREADVIARLGGDEFAVLLTDVSNADALKAVNNHLQNNIRNYNKKNNKSYKLIMSSGIAYYDPNTPCSIDKLLYKADNIMYHNKKNKIL